MNPEDDCNTKTSASAVGAGTPQNETESELVLRELDEKFEERIRAFSDSERLSEEDFAIRINVRD